MTVKAIFELKGNRLTVCHAISPDEDRPSKLEANEKTVLFVCKRSEAKSTQQKSVDKTSVKAPLTERKNVQLSEPKKTSKAQSLEGTIFKHPRAGTKASLLTGNFYVKLTNGKNYIVKPSDNVSEDDIEKLVGKQVKLTVVFKPGVHWDPSDNKSGVQGPAGKSQLPNFYSIQKIELKN